MALFSSWLYVRVSWCHGFIFFLVISEGVMTFFFLRVIFEGIMALFFSWLYVSVSWLYFLPGYM